MPRKVAILTALKRRLLIFAMVALVLTVGISAFILLWRPPPSLPVHTIAALPPAPVTIRAAPKAIQEVVAQLGEDFDGKAGIAVAEKAGFPIKINVVVMRGINDAEIVDFAKLPLTVAWGQDALNPTAVQESKRVSLPVWTKAGATA